MDRLKGKVAIITGAASGMGLATAKLFATEGAKVVATDLRGELVKSEVAKIGFGEDIIIGEKLDVTNYSDWEAVTALTIEKFGRIDVLVNNAGLIFMMRGILDTSVDDWKKLIDVDCNSVYYGAKNVLPHMIEQNCGSIVNISSIAGFVSGNADGGCAGYCAAKGAVRTLTKHIAQNFAQYNIRCNSIHPGAIYTPMAGSDTLTRDDIAAHNKFDAPLPPYVGEPEDIANAVLYFASDESKYTTGAELAVDGGFTSR